MRISTTAIALALTLGQSVSASFAGCYDPAVLELDLGNSTANASTLAECSAYCGQDGESTIALFGNDSCACTSAQLPTVALRPAAADFFSPICADGLLTADNLSTDYAFSSCSYAASTTAQFASTSNSTSECFSACTGYPAVFAFPTISGWNCYCAMTSTGGGPTDCADNTFYAYAKEAETRRSRR